MAIVQTNTRKRIVMPYQVPRTWSGQTAENIQLNFEKLFQIFSDVQETEAGVTGIPSDYVFNPATSTYYELWTSGTGITPVGIPVGGVSTTGGGGASRMSPPFADGPYLQIGNAVLNASYSAGTATSTSIVHDLIWDFDCSWIIRTDTLATGLGLYTVGVCQTIDGTFATPLPAQAGCYFRSDDGGQWTAYCHDGTTLSSGVIVAGVANSTRYTLRIRKIANVAFFSVNGGPEFPVSSNVPVTSRVGVGPIIRLLNRTGTTRTLYFSRAWAVYGS